MEKLPLSGQEKEKKVCELIRQGKMVREIAAMVHLSFSDIKRIRKKNFETGEQDAAIPSKRIQALKLIQEGKSNLDIAIELDLSANEVLEFRQEYLTLKNDDDLLRIYRVVKDKVPAFLEIFKQMKEEDLSPDEAVWALEQNRTFKQMSLQYESLLKEVSPLRREIELLAGEKQELVEQVQELTWKLDDLEDTENIFSVESDELLADNRWTRKVRRRPRIRKNREEGIFDPTEISETFL